MSEKKPMPQCPYCGAEMRIEKPLFVSKYEEIPLDAKAGWCSQATCGECGAASPFVSGMETEKDVYEVVRETAMIRYKTLNRVLTRKEVEDAFFKTKEPICCEIMWCGTKKITWITDAVVPYRELPRHMQYAIEDDEEEVDEVHGFYIMERQEPKWKEYGKTWRCWLRKPTLEEMAETPWGGEKNE